MIRDWTVECKDCHRPFTYSDRSVQEAAARGESRPERCTECRAAHNKDTSRMGAAYVDLDPGTRPVGAGGLKPGRLGRLDRGARPHEAVDTPPPTVAEGTFGITDGHMSALLATMEQYQVVVVEAPTGSGKSTFLPWRLLYPPAPHPPDAVTRHGLIIVTQPRIEATQGIPNFVAGKLHGSAIGAGVDIGFRHSKAVNKADSRNRLLYVTDGTLLNMIRRGELQACSTVIIDEAHERSLNIDLILALMRREMVALPHLRLLIVSATIKAEQFAGFFRPELRATSVALPGKEGKPVHERFRADPIPVNQWPARMPDEAAAEVYGILRWMACGERPFDIPESIPAYDGDVLVFLPGRRAIQAAVKALEDLVDEDKELAGRVEVLPLYSELPQSARNRALKPEHRGKGTRWHVIVATNIAETSLTIEGIRHVVDSGLINSTEWDPATLTSIVRPKPHSQSGLRQRRGRAGRTDPGIWHCLFTREQFDELAPETPPEIVRAPLESVVLAAAAAGVSDAASLRWLPPGPPEEEMRRARATLYGMGAITADGDPTALGAELALSRESFSAAGLLICADEAGVAVEAATMLAAMHERQWVKALRWSTTWPAVTRLHVDRLHSAVFAECADDLDATLTLVRMWEKADNEQRGRLADRCMVSGTALNVILRRREELLRSLQSRTKTAEVRPVEPALADRLRRVIAWSGPNTLYQQVDGEWRAVLVPRGDRDVVTRIHAGARPALDPDSLLARRTAMPEFLAAPVRDRRRRWVSPLQEPEDRVTLSYCVALRREHLADDVPLLVHMIGHRVSGADLRRSADTAMPPVVLPGDRILADPMGRREDGIQVRVLTRLHPVPIPDIELDRGEDTDDDTGDLAQRSSRSQEQEGLDAEPSTAGDLLDESGADDRAGSIGGPAPAPHPDGAIPSPFADLEIVAADFDAVHPVVAVTRIANGTVYVGADPIAAAERFEARFKPGDVCTVRIVGVRTLRRDRRKVLIAREDETGVEIPLTGLELGFGVRDASLTEDLVGRSVRLAVAAVDVESGLIQLSVLPWIADALARLSGPAVLSATIVDAFNESVYIALHPDETALRTDDPLIILDVRASYLPQRPMEMSLGMTVRVRLDRRTPRTPEVAADLPEMRVPTGPFERRGARLILVDTPTSRDVLAVYRAGAALPLDEAVILHRALSSLVVKALRPRTRVIDVTGLTALQPQQSTAARIVSATDARITVELDGGTRTTIPTAHFAWPGQPVPSVLEDPARAVGATVDAFVTDVEPDSGRLLLTLRDPRADPFAGLNVGTVLAGTVTGLKGSGATVTVDHPTVELFVPKSEAGVRGGALETTLPVGTAVRVRLIDVDATSRRVVASRWFHGAEIDLPYDVIDAIQAKNNDLRGAAGASRQNGAGSDTRTDVNRLRALVGESADLRVNADNQLTLRWAEEPWDIHPKVAVGSLRELVAGLRSEIAVPTITPLDVARRQALSGAFRCVIKVEPVPSTGQPGRATWRLVIVHPRHTAIEDLVSRITAAFPQRVRADRLQAVGSLPFRDAREAFTASQKARRAAGQPTSHLSYLAPHNYVDLADGDSYEQFAQRLAGHGLALQGACLTPEDRIKLLDQRPVR